MPLPTPRIVFFDAGGTLIHPHPSVGHVYTEVAARHGIPCDPEALDVGFRTAFRQHLNRVRNNGGLAYGPTLSTARAHWGPLVRDAFLIAGGAMAEAAATAQGNLEPPGTTPFDRFFLDVFDEFAHPHRFRFEDGAAETLRALQSRGIATGLLSNWDARLRSIIEASDIRPLLDVTIISAEAGYAKPHPGIFAAARAAAEAALAAPIDDPATIFLVGDSPGDDVTGAREAGWTPLLFEPVPSESNVQPPPATVVRQLRDIVTLLQ